MGQLITTVVGGVLGFMIGGPMGAQIGMMLGGMIGSTLFGPTIKGPRLNDLKVTASTYGVAIPEVYGSVRLGGNMIWTAGIKETSKTSRAGKGGPKQTTYSYSASFAMGICKGEIDKITRIWADSKLIFDTSAGTTRTPSSDQNAIFGSFLTAMIKGKKQKKYNFRAYVGNESQLPDSLIEADKGSGNVSAHRGLAYIVFENMPLEDFGNRIPQLTFEVTKAQKQSFPSIVVTDSEGDAIPNIGDKTWVPDWETGRLLAFDISGSGSTYVLNLSDMKLAYTSEENLRGGVRWTYAPGLNLVVRTPNSNNSGQVDLYDMTTLTQIGSFGENANSLTGYYYVSGPNEGRRAFANSGQIGVATAIEGENGTYTITLCSWTRYTWIVSPSGKPLSFYRAPWTPSALIKGASGSQLIGFRNFSGTLQVRNWNYFGHNLGGGGGNVYWEVFDAPDGTVSLQPYSGETFVAKVVLFDPTDDHIFCIGTSDSVPCVFKYSLDNGVYKFIRKHVGMKNPTTDMRWSRLAGGTFGWLFSAYTQVGKLNEIDLQNGDWIRETSFGNAWGSQVYAGQNQYWDDTSSSLVVETQDAYRRIYFRDTIGTISLPDIVSDIAQKSGALTVDDIDVTGLDPSPVIGYQIDRECSARDALKQLATAYLFDCYESDYKLCFRNRGSGSAVTIPESWLARNGNGEAMKETLTQELEMPLKITVNYYDVSRDHQQGTQSAKRKSNPFPTMWTSKEDIIDLPLTWDPDGAKQCADKLLKMAWANRTGYQFNLPWRYLKYDPTDVITVQMDLGTTYALRLTDANIGADFVIEARAVSEKATAYVSTAVGNPGEAPEQSVAGDYVAFPMIINTPLLRDEDYDTASQSICYVSVGTIGLTFGGAVVYMNDGLDYRSVGAVNSETVTGYAINALPFTTAYESTDEDSVLKIRLADPSMELESITQDEMLNSDANAALVGNEVIQFRDVELQSNGEWWLSGLRRARRGTNYALRDHAASERFLILNAASLARFARPPESYVTTRTFKAVPPGTTVEEATPYSSALTPRDLMPYTPEDVRITDDGTDVTITMQRRSRLIAPLESYLSTIHYKEGDKTSAKITYKIWPGLTVNDTATTTDATVTGSIPLFDSAGDDLSASLAFPLADLGTETKFLIRLTEIGEVEGIPKWVEFERLSEDRWNATDFY